MDADRFDQLARALTDGSTRRGVTRALGSLSLTGILAPLLGLADAEARKKKGKKKKKKCKGGTKKCGKKCIPVTSCCSAADCGTGGGCLGGACFCSVGFKDCQGSCIPFDACCGCDGPCVECQAGECAPKMDGTTCGVGLEECQGGECVCPCPTGSVCLVNDSCAVDCSAPGAFCSATPPCNGTCSPSIEGGSYCRQTISDCSVLQTCTSTAQCPAGTFCGDASGICGSVCRPLCTP